MAVQTASFVSIAIHLTCTIMMLLDKQSRYVINIDHVVVNRVRLKKKYRSTIQGQTIRVLVSRISWSRDQ